MCNAFIRAGGTSAMGVAQSNANGDVHDWDGLLVQDFTGGTLESPVIMYRQDIGTAYFTDRRAVVAYNNDANGPTGFLGLPRSDRYVDGPDWYIDDDHDFRDGPITYFQHGFIARDKTGGNTEAHRNFPEIKRVTWETEWVPTGSTDPDGNPTYRFTVRGTINDADPNPGGKEGDDPAFKGGYWVYIDDGNGTDGGIFNLDLDQESWVDFIGYTRTLPYKFYFFGIVSSAHFVSKDRFTLLGEKRVYPPMQAAHNTLERSPRLTQVQPSCEDGTY